MRYNDTKEISAEILRLVIPAMAGHDAPFHPLTYAVWYEYISARNAELKSALDDTLAQSRKVSESDIEELFERHIATRDVQAARQLCEAIGEQVRIVSSSTKAAGTHANQYVDSLDHIDRRLQAMAEPSDLRNIVAELTGCTSQMRDSVTTMEQQLSDSDRKINELREALSHAQNQALTDPLTGLVNRRGFNTAIQEILSGDGSATTQTCLLMIDIDHFKRINDTHGHLIGDQVIRSVAQALKHGVKGKDTVARYGGEEFSVLLPDTSMSGANSVAEQLRATIERGRLRRVGKDETLATVTVSIGITNYRTGESPDQFIERADQALYDSKRNGRNRVTARAAA